MRGEPQADITPPLAASRVWRRMDPSRDALSIQCTSKPASPAQTRCCDPSALTDNAAEERVRGM